MIDEDTDDGWSEIDPKNPPSSPKEELEIEYESEAPDTPAEKSISEPVSYETDEEPEEEPEELQGIQTKGAEKRIRKLVAQRKERDEQLAISLEKINALESMLSDKDKNISDYRRQSFDSKKEELKNRIESAQKSFSTAFDEGDKDLLVKSQTDLSEAQAELKIFDFAKVMSESRQAPQQVPQQARQQTDPPRPQFDKGATEWAQENEWFGKDKVGTSIALAVDQSLKEEGFDPLGSDYYTELNRRLSEELPQRLRPSRDVKSAQVVAGQSRRSAPSNKVRLTQEDVSLAKKWGLSLERYAAEKKKVERSAGEYTQIG